MKASYIKPTTELIHVSSTQLLQSLSIAIGNGYQENDVVLSRRHNSIFEDDAPTSGSGSIWDE